VLGGAAGILAAIYGLGGAVAYLRFVNGGLPADQALGLLGIRQILLFGAVSALVILPSTVLLVFIALKAQDRLRRYVPPSPSTRQLPPSWLRQLLSRKVPAVLLVGLVIAGIAFISAVVAGLALASLSGILAFDATSVSEAAGLAAIISGGLGTLFSWIESSATDAFRHLLTIRGVEMTIVVILVLFASGIALAIEVPLRMPDTWLRLSDGTCIRGLYLGRDSSGVHLVDGVGKKILTIASANIAALQIGQFEPAKETKIIVVPCPMHSVTVVKRSMTGEAIAVVTPGEPAGDAIAGVYLTRVIQIRASLVSAIDDGWRIQPPVAINELDVPVSDSGSIMSAGVSHAALVDLGRLHGQLAITYGGWSRSNARVHLKPIDRRRICRTIAFVDFVETDLKSLPEGGLSRTDFALPDKCPSTSP
jgi:hypothetical protein